MPQLPYLSQLQGDECRDAGGRRAIFVLGPGGCTCPVENGSLEVGEVVAVRVLREIDGGPDETFDFFGSELFRDHDVTPFSDRRFGAHAWASRAETGMGCGTSLVFRRG